MGHESSICGFIMIEGDVALALGEIEQLPTTSEEDDFPFLTSNMFSHTESPQYRECMIHFAASYKDICGSWEEWDTKFELLLNRIPFERAKVLIEDCYLGDLIAVWSRKKDKDGKQVTSKFVKMLNYRDEPDFEYY